MKKLLTILFAVALGLNLSAQVPDYVPTDGLVAWYPFNGNANDESGNGNDGVIDGATPISDRYAIENAHILLTVKAATYSSNLILTSMKEVYAFGLEP